MNLGYPRRLSVVLLIVGLSGIASLTVKPSLGDEPGRFRFSKLFRFGSRPAPKAESRAEPTEESASSSLRPTAPFSTNSSNGVTPRILPQPRENRSVSDAPPIFVRVALIRADDGKQFGEFMQVFADGTVIDAEGVHRVSREVLRGLVDALRDADALRASGHCGAPSTDFIEQVHLTVYEQSFGRLRANHFSYSGNPQGCDASIRRLHAAIETFMIRMRGPIAAAPAASTARPAPITNAPTTIDAPKNTDFAPPPPEVTGPSVPLTPES